MAAPRRADGELPPAMASVAPWARPPGATVVGTAPGLAEMNGGAAALLTAGAETPPYTVRVSARARRVRLVMNAARGLEVVVPRGFSRRRIPEIVEGKRDWFMRAAARVEAQRRRLEADPPRLPGRIVLAAVGEEWEVEYRPGRAASRSGGAGPSELPRSGAVSPGGDKGDRSTVTVRERPGFHLVVTGDVSDAAACRQALGRWLRRRARRTLVPRLEELARIHDLQYRRVSIREQRTRWGSCSPKKSLSLNARLLLLPPAAADYVLLHELCHTVVMDHSSRFWRLLEAHDPHYRDHRKSVRTVARSLPSWLDHSIDEAGPGSV